MADMDMAGGEEARVPPGLTKELLSDRLFKQACKVIQSDILLIALPKRGVGIPMASHCSIVDDG